MKKSHSANDSEEFFREEEDEGMNRERKTGHAGFSTGLQKKLWQDF